MPSVPKFKLPPLDLPEAVGERISSIRKERGLNQAALADLVGVSRKLVSDYETGRVRLYDEMVIRFAMALGVTTDNLLGVDIESSSSSQPSLRFTRRFKELEQLPEPKKKKILNTLDDLIRANS